MDNGPRYTPENNAKKQSIADTRAAILALLDSQNGTARISIDQLNRPLQEALTLLEGDLDAVSATELQSKLDKLVALQASIDGFQYSTDPLGKMTPILESQRPFAQRQISAALDLLQQMIQNKKNEQQFAQEKRSARALSDKIKEKIDLPDTISNQLDTLASLSSQAEEAIAGKPDKTYFVSAPELDKKIRTQLEQKDILVTTLKNARREQRSTIQVDQVFAYDNETIQIGEALNLRQEVITAHAMLKIIFDVWKESLAYQPTIAEIRNVLVIGDISSQSQESLSKQLIALENLVVKAKADPQLTTQSLPENYAKEIENIFAKIKETERFVFTEWTKKVESTFFDSVSGTTYSFKTTFERVSSRFPDDASYAVVTKTDRDVMQRTMRTFESIANAQSWTNEQKEWWNTKLLTLKTVEEKMNKTIESKESQEKKVQVFLELLRSTEENPPKKMQTQDDEVRELLASLDTTMRDLRASLSEAEYLRVEKEFLMFKFRYIKLVILNQIHSDMNNGSSHTSYVGKTSEILFENKLIDLESAINELRKKGENRLAEEMDTELKRFKQMFSALRVAFYAGSTLEAQVVGAKDSKAGAQRQIPQQGPDWFPSTQDLIYSFKGGTELTTNPNLRFKGEKPLNENCTPRSYLIPDFDHPGQYIEKQDYVANLRGDCKRIMDMIARNTLPARLRSKILDEGRTATTEEMEVIKMLESEDFFKSVHIEEYNLRRLPRVVVTAAKTLYGDEISSDLVREAWYDYILFLHFSFMSPGSPSNDDQIYKAGQPIKYIADGKLAGTTSASAVHVGCLVGAYNPDFEEDGGAAYFLDRFIVEKSSLSKPVSLAQKVGMGLSGVVTAEPGMSKNREKVLSALHHEHLDSDFGFLADLPFMVSHPTVWKTVPFVPSPLGYMIFRNEGGRKYSDKDSEVPVLRWGGVSDEQIEQGYIPRPITGNDFVTPVKYRNAKGELQIDYDILYEAIPLEKTLESTELNKWYNNGKNIESLRKILYSPSSKDVFDPDKVAALQNDAKYIASFLPDDMGTNVSAGTYDGKKVFQRFTIVSVFARCLDLITNTELNLHKAEDEMIRLMSVLGEGKKNSRAVEAIILSLKQIVGSEEESQRSAENLLNQVTKRLEFK